MPYFSAMALAPSHQRVPYLGRSRARAVEILSLGLRDREILQVLTGAAGVGKSIVLNASLAALADEPVRLTRLSNPQARPWGQRELAGQILGRTIETPTDEMIAAVIAELTPETTAEPLVIIAVDDAQTLADDAMEFLLRLASPARGSKLPPQLILAGRGEFWEPQSQSQFRLVARLAQRVTLEAFSGIEAGEYIVSRLKLAGGSVADATDEALTGILLYSGGLPEGIDRIVATSIAIGACRRRRVLTGDIVEAAIASLAEAPTSPRFVPGSNLILTPADGRSAPSLEHIESEAVSALPANFVPLMAQPVQTVLPVDLADPVRPGHVSPPVPDHGSGVIARMLRATWPPEKSIGPTSQRRQLAVISARVASSGGTAGSLIRFGVSAVALSPGMARGVARLWSHLRPPDLIKPTLAIEFRWTAQHRAAPAVVATLLLLMLGGLVIQFPEPRAHVVEAINSAWLRGSMVFTHGSDVQKAPPLNELISQVHTSSGAGQSPDMVALLLRLGNVMLLQGDILSARSVFERAAAAGSAKGATGAGKTYDPGFLPTVAVPGRNGDVARAIEWYRQASNGLGDSEAQERLKALTVQTSQ
jgi:type II secretory pathway predicted ATPase ExeA